MGTGPSRPPAHRPMSTEPLGACDRPGAGSQGAPRGQPLPDESAALPASARGPGPGLDSVLELLAPLTLDRAPHGGLDPTPQKPGQRALCGASQPLEREVGERWRRAGRPSVPRPSLPSPTSLSTHTGQAGQRGLTAEGSLGALVLLATVPPPQPGNHSANPQIRASLPLGRTEPWCLHFPGRRGSAEGWGHVSPA